MSCLRQGRPVPHAQVPDLQGDRSVPEVSVRFLGPRMDYLRLLRMVKMRPRFLLSRGGRLRIGGLRG